MNIKKLLFAAAIILLTASCSGSKREYYRLEGGDPNIDWFEFINDSTIRWVAPGPMPMESRYEETENGDIIVYTAPFSKGTMHRINSRTIEGDVPFFEGTWKKSR